MKRFSILIAVLAVLATGCRAEVRLLLDVTEDGSGTLAAEVGINQQLRDIIDQLAGDGDAIIAGLDLGLVGESSTRVEGDMTVYTTRIAFDDVDTVPEAAAGDFTSFSVELTDAGTSLEATLDLAGELDLSQFPIDLGGIDTETLQARILLSLPGEVADHNADEIMPDGRFAWDIPLDDELYMYATTLYPKASFPWWLVGLLALSAALAAGVWLAALRHENKGNAKRPPAPIPPPVQNPAQETSPATQSGEPTTGAGSPFFDLDRDS